MGSIRVEYVWGGFKCYLENKGGCFYLKKVVLGWGCLFRIIFKGYFLK